jgi:hypothetical protein
MQTWLEDNGLSSAVEAAVDAVETTLDSEHLEGLRQWIDNQPNLAWLNG